MKITEPGIYYDLPADQYHAQNEWLSWSRMKHLIPPSTPAHFKAAMGAAEERKRHYDLGKVVHTLALGDGDKFEVVQALNRQKEPYDADGYTTKSAQEHRDAIYADGRVPILRYELEAAEAMADAIQSHPAAASLIADGRPEVSMFWVDEDTGVKCRARADWLPNPHEGRPFVVADVKTTGIATGAAPREFARVAAKLGYYGQMCHYLDGVRAVGLDADPEWVFVVVETAAPHLVQVGRFINVDDLRLARGVVDHCRRLYAECAAADRWPGYGDGITDLQLPMWLHFAMEEAEVIEDMEMVV